MKRKMKKRGEITTKQIVTLIILILSFSVILFLIFRLDLGNKSNAEICRNSVLLKSKSALSQGSLDCRTSYTCIGGDCEGFSATKEIDARTKNETLNALAEEMEQCWWMFGEGEVEYSDTSAEGEVRYSGHAASRSVDCSICSIVSLGQGVGEITYSEFYEFLENGQKSNSQTYLQYLYKVSDKENINFQNQIVDEEILRESFLVGEEYAIITGIDNNLIDKINEDEFLNVYILPQSEISETQCDNFLTKA